MNSSEKKKGLSVAGEKISFVLDVSSGFLRGITNKQNGDGLLKALPDDDGGLFFLAARYGMKHFFIASWNRSGFDTDYPEYHPDLELGTPVDLERGCRYITDQGGLVTFYLNARIFDVESDYFAVLGKNGLLRTAGNVTPAGLRISGSGIVFSIKTSSGLCCWGVYSGARPAGWKLHTKTIARAPEFSRADNSLKNLLSNS